MKWKSLLLFLCPLIAFSAPKKDLQFSYVVSTNDVPFYLNQPIFFKVSVCEKKEMLCTELAQTAPFTLTKASKALHLVLTTKVPNKTFQAVITKRKIFWEDAKIKFEISYGRNDIFKKFVEETFFYKDLVRALPDDRLLKDYVNTETGVVEVSHLLIFE